jgi:hypothetical protein
MQLIETERERERDYALYSGNLFRVIRDLINTRPDLFVENSVVDILNKYFFLLGFLLSSFFFCFPVFLLPSFIKKKIKRRALCVEKIVGILSVFPPSKRYTPSDAIPQRLGHTTAF